MEAFKKKTILTEIDFFILIPCTLISVLLMVGTKYKIVDIQKEEYSNRNISVDFRKRKVEGAGGEIARYIYRISREDI